MAAELQVQYHVSAVNVYFLLRNSTGSIWNGTSFVAYATADLGAYDLPATEQGTASAYYTASMPAVDAGLYYIVAKERVGADPAEADPTAGTGTVSWNGSAAVGVTFQAKIGLIDDNTNAVDRYTVAWFRNGEPVTTGITSPTIQVIKATDGTDLIASTAMTQIATTGLYRYNESTSRVVSGAIYLARAQATIDGSTRTWYQWVGRDV